MDILRAVGHGKLKRHPVHSRVAEIARMETQDIPLSPGPCLKESANPHIRFLKGSETVDEPDTAGRTLLYLNATFQDKETIETMLERGADPNLSNRQGRTPVHAAARSGCSASLAILLRSRYRADLNIQDAFGCTPLMNAVSRSDGRDLADMLLQRGADANIPNNKGWYPAHVLAAHNEAQWLENLATAGADLNVIDNDGMNLWSVAIYNKAIDVLKYLVACPSIQFAVLDCGSTALHFAAYFGDIETLQALESPRLGTVDISAPNKNGKVAIQVAEWRRDNNLDWFRGIQTLGPGNRGGFQLDEDPYAWYFAFEKLLDYLNSLAGDGTHKDSSGQISY